MDSQMNKAPWHKLLVTHINMWIPLLVTQHHVIYGVPIGLSLIAMSLTTHGLQMTSYWTICQHSNNDTYQAPHVWRGETPLSQGHILGERHNS